MLVLTRKPGEKILIGDGITLTVLDVQGNRVRLGIDAPDDVRILRGELNVFADFSTETAAQRREAEAVF